MLILKKTQRGFSMVEVLVSLVVIGVGVLGMTGLQVASMKGTSNAHSRNIASMLAMDLSDRMRANPTGVDDGFYVNNVNCTKNENRCRNKTAYCSPTKIARLDVQEVMCGIYRKIDGVVTREGGVDKLLRSGSLAIAQNTGCPEITDTRKLRITIGWSNSKIDSDQADADMNQQIQICVNP